MAKKKSAKVSFTFEERNSLTNLENMIEGGCLLSMADLESKRSKMNEQVPVQYNSQDYSRARYLLSLLSDEMIEADRPDPRCRLCWAHIGNNMSHDIGCLMADVDDVLNALLKELRKE